MVFLTFFHIGKCEKRGYITPRCHIPSLYHVLILHSYINRYSRELIIRKSFLLLYPDTLAVYLIAVRCHARLIQRSLRHSWVLLLIHSPCRLLAGPASISTGNVIEEESLRQYWRTAHPAILYFSEETELSWR